MLRQKRETEAKIGGGSYCRIRKRACSSSSSSSLARKCRFKRAILIGRRGGSTTPAPPWKKGASPSSTAHKHAQLLKQSPPHGGGTCGAIGREATAAAAASARKLAATLWEMNGIPSPLPPNLSDPSHSPFSKRMDRRRTVNHRRLRSSPLSQKLELAHSNLGEWDSQGNASLMELKTPSRGRAQAKCIAEVKTSLKDVSNSLIASKELLKVLNRIWCMEEHNASSVPLVTALRAELDRACIQINQLIQDRRSSKGEIGYLLKQFAEEKAAWKRKERDRIHEAIASVVRELEVEKKLRRQTERLNKKLGKELMETKAALTNAAKELKSERRAREVLEEVYDELARGIGEDRAHAEEMKKESLRVREEVEKEREMLQLADVLREERVQMKLLEAKYQFEEKNAALDKLRNELEAYLSSKTRKVNGDGSPNFSSSKEFQDYIGRMCLVDSAKNEITEVEDTQGVVADKEEHEGEDSADSDLHSIELNVDNRSRSYKWGYARGGKTIQESMPKSNKLKGRNTSAEELEFGNIYLGRRTSVYGEQDLGAEARDNSERGFNDEALSNLVSQAQREDCEEEIKRYKTLEGLRDHILSASGMVLSQSIASPNRQWDQAL